MSTYADPDKAYVWLDGDGFRGPAGAAMPLDPFAVAPISGSTLLLPFGGIEAGFEIMPTRDLKKLPVWNRRSANYKVIKGVKEQRAKLRCVDYSPATVLTVLQGGSIAETGPSSGIFQWTEGDDEDFSLLLVVRDEGVQEAWWSPRVTLVNSPGRNMGGESLDGFEFEVEALQPFIPLTNWNPLAVTAITVLPPTKTLAVAATQQLKVYNSNGVDVTAAPTTYVSSTPATATVSVGGLITGVAAGTTTITATAATGGFTDTCVVTVTA